METLSLGQAVLSIVGDSRQLETTVARLGATTSRGLSGIEAQSRQAVGALNRVGEAGAAGFARAQQGLSSLTGLLGRLSALLGGISFAAIGTGAIRLAGQLEQAEIAFTTLLGSGEKAQSFLNELANYAARTPFEFVGLRKASRQLLAFGFDAENVVPILNRVGDAVSALGGGQFEIDRLIRALGQLSAKGRLTAEELLQITELGIPAYAILQEKLGLTQKQLANVADQGISSAQAINALLEGMADRYGGAMAAASQSLLGLFSTLKDNVTLTLTSLGTEAVEALNLKGVVQSLIEFAGNLRAALEQGGLSGLFDQYETQIGTLAGAISGVLVLAVSTLGAAIYTALAPVALFAAAGAALYLAWNSNFLGLADLVDTVISGIQVAIGWVVGKIEESYGSVANFKARWGEAFTLAGEKAGQLYSAVQDSVDRVQTALANNNSQAATILGGLGEIVGNTVRAIGNAFVQLPNYFVAVLNSSSELGRAIREIFGEQGIGLVLDGFRKLVFGYVVEPFQNLVAPIAAAGANVINVVGSWLGKLYGIFEPVIKFVGGIGKGLAQAMGNLGDTAVGTLTDELKESATQAGVTFETFTRNSLAVGSGLNNVADGWSHIKATASDAGGVVLTELENIQANSEQAATAGQGLADANTEVATTSNNAAAGLLNLKGGASDAGGEVEDLSDKIERNTQASVAWISRLTRETETGLKPAATTIDLLTQALDKQYFEQERLARAGLIDGAQYAIAEEKINLLVQALEELSVFSTLTIEPEVVVAREMPMPDVQAMVLEPVELPIPDTSAWVDYEEVISNLIDTQNRLTEASRQEAEEAATLRYVGDVIAAYERANGPLNSYQEAMDALSQAGLWNAETQKIMAENFGVTVTSVEAADEALSGITEKLLSLGSDADPAALRAIRVELDALKGTGFIDDSVLDSLYSYLGTLEGLVAPLQTLREEVRGLYSDQELTAEQLSAINDILAEFEPGDADSYEETREALRGIGEEADLSGEQMQALLDLLSEANLSELEFDTSKAEDAALTLLTSLEDLIHTTGLFGEGGDAAASLLVEGYAAIQAAQEATRVAQEAAAVAHQNDTAKNRKAMADSAQASQQAWVQALSIIGSGLQQVGAEIEGLGGAVVDMAGTAISHAGNIAAAFATDPTGVTGMIAIATAAVDLLIKAFNHAAEAAKRAAEQTETLRDMARAASEYSAGSQGIETQAALINLETRYKQGQLGDAAYYGQKRNLENQQAKLDAEQGNRDITDWFQTESAKLDPAMSAEQRTNAIRMLSEAATNRYNAIAAEYNAKVGANNAQMNADMADAARRRAEEEKDKPAPGGSIAGKRSRIGELREQQERSTSSGEVQRLQGQIEQLEADIQKMLGEGEGSSRKGSIADLEKQVSDLRKKQQNATGAGEYSGYQGQISKLQDRIAKIKGEAAESIAKGSLDYYEKLIGDLRDKQGKATSAGEYARLQNQIEGYESQIAKIRGEVEKSAAKGTINYYEEQIRSLKERRGNTKSQSEYAKLEGQIEGYEKQIAKIRGDVEKSVAKGTINYYEAQIRLAKEEQGNTKSQSEYAKLQDRIEGYEKQISKIRGEGAEGAAKGTIDYYEEQIRALKTAQGKTKDPAQYAKLQGQIEGYEKQIDRIKGEVEKGNVKGSIDYYEERIRDLKARQGQTTNKQDFAKLQQEINKFERAVADIESGASDNLTNSIGFYKDIISDLKRRQEDARTEAEFADYQKQIDGYQAEIDRISGEVDEAYGKGTVGYYEELISGLRDQQKHAKTPEQHAELQRQIEGYQSQIDRIEGEVDAATIKGSVAYYENEISKLRDRQKAATSRQEHRELETQIEAFQKQVLAITEDAGADAIEGTLGFYEARISALREAQAFAKSPGDYAAIEREISGYQAQIDEIKGLGDLEGSIDYYTDLLQEKQKEFDATADAAVRAALGAEIAQLESTIKELEAAAKAGQSTLDAIRERYKVAAEDFASTFVSAMQNASDFEGFLGNLEGELRDTVRDAIIQGANSADDFQALSDNVARALSDGTVSQTELDALQDQATQIAESRKGVYDLLDDLTLFGESLSESAKEMKGMNAELTNVPSGLKLAEHRFAAAAAEAEAAREKAAAPPKTPEPPVPTLPVQPNLTLSTEEKAALEAQQRTMLEQQALYLKERKARWTKDGKLSAEQAAYFEDHSRALGDDVMNTSLDDLWERAGPSITSRGSYYQDLLRKWQEEHDPGAGDDMVRILPDAPGSLTEPLLSTLGSPDMLSRLTNLETDKMRGALGVGDYGFTPGLDRPVSVDISDRMEKVLREVAGNSGMTFTGDIHLHGVQDIRALRDDLLGVERGVNRQQHGSSVAK